MTQWAGGKSAPGGSCSVGSQKLALMSASRKVPRETQLAVPQGFPGITDHTRESCPLAKKREREGDSKRAARFLRSQQARLRQLSYDSYYLGRGRGLLCPAGAAAARHAGGWGGIRTHEELAPLPVFKTGALNRSATHPWVTNSGAKALIANDCDPSTPDRAGVGTPSFSASLSALPVSPYPFPPLERDALSSSFPSPQQRRGAASSQRWEGEGAGDKRDGLLQWLLQTQCSTNGRAAEA